jgi:hypothetical protein
MRLSLCNLKAVSFIPLLARLAKEFGLFMEEQRSGLLTEDTEGEINVLRDLVRTDTEHFDQDHHERVDDKYLIVMKKLRQMGLLKKEDIQQYVILEGLWDDPIFAEKRFRFLVEWDPSSLLQLQSDRYEHIPLHNTALKLSLCKHFRLYLSMEFVIIRPRKGLVYYSRKMLLAGCRSKWLVVNMVVRMRRKS